MNPEFDWQAAWRSYRAPIVSLVVFVLAIVVGAAAWSTRRNLRESQAQETLFKISAAPAAQRLKAVGPWMGTHYAALTLLDIAEERLHADDNTQALEAYRQFLGQYPSHPLASVAQYGSGLALERQQQWDQALTAYRQAGENPAQDHYAALALLAIARIEQGRGNAAAAASALKACAQRFGSLSYGQEAQARLNSARS